MLMFFLLCYFGLLCTIGLVSMALKLMKRRLSPLSIVGSGIIAVLLIVGQTVAWKFSAPMTDQMILHRKVTNLIGNQASKGLITKIFVGGDQPVKKGAPLYEIDARPNQYAINQAAAQVALAEQNVLLAKAQIEVAAARVEQAKAGESLRKAQLDVAVKTRELSPAAISKLAIVTAQQSYEASLAATINSEAEQRATELSLDTAKNNLAASRAQLELAELNFGQNVTRAPSDGYLVNFQTTEGTMTTTLIKQSQGLFLNTEVPPVVAAVFPQNLVKNIRPGDRVEVAFKSMPGRIVDGTVDSVLNWTGEGQIQRESSSQLPVAARLRSKGKLLVRVNLDDQDLAESLPLGAAGSVAIYTEVGGAFHIFSKIALRIRMWMNYLPV